MKYVIGIDVGGSTTKIVGLSEAGQLIQPIFVRATDPMTSLYGAFGKFTDENSIALSDISRVMLTGVGSSFVSKPIYGLTCEHATEFTSAGLGGLYLSGLRDAIVVSMGTGTAIVHASAGGSMDYLGGTGVGGGTLVGLSKKLLDMEDINHICDLALEGDLDRIDLRISDIANDTLPGMNQTLTAANFGKISDIATKSDIALGIINMVFETCGMMAIFAARSHNVKDIVLTGNLTTLPQCREIFDNLSRLFNFNFIIPENAQFATVIGAALSAE